MINSFLMNAIVGAIGIFSLIFMLLLFLIFNSVMTYSHIKDFSLKNTVSKAVSWIL